LAGRHNDCGLSFINERWLLSRFKTDGDQRGVLEATVRLTPTGEYQMPKLYTIGLHTIVQKRSQGVGYSTANQYWWPAAIEEAVLTYGSEIGKPDILTSGDWPTRGLTLLTGYTSWSYFPDASYGKQFANNPFVIVDQNNGVGPADKVCELADKAFKCPVVLWTKAEKDPKKKLVTQHAYSVLGAATVANGTRMIALRNPWGLGSWYDVEAVLPQLAGVTHFPAWQNGPNQ
jgi:hypothetical protein